MSLSMDSKPDLNVYTDKHKNKKVTNKPPMDTEETHNNDKTAQPYYNDAARQNKRRQTNTKYSRHNY